MTLGKRKRKGMQRIPSEWYGLLPGQRIVFWLRVALIAKRRGVSKRNYERIKHIALQQMKKGDL